MSIYDDYITGDDKPFAENINDALLLSNVFNFNVPVSLPSDFTNGEWINNTTQRKAGVSIIQLPEGLPNTLTVNGDKITGTGTMKLLVYPNFNSFGKFYRITWESENSNIQVNLKTKNGTMIAQNINNGLITSTSVELQKLQQILVEVVFTASDTLTGLVITMQNKIKDDRHTVDLGMSSVTGLNSTITDLESSLDGLDTRLNTLEENVPWTYITPNTIGGVNPLVVNQLAYARVGNICFLNGNFSISADSLQNMILTTLPQAVRPNKYNIESIWFQNGGVGRLNIRGTGEVYVYGTITKGSLTLINAVWICDD